MFLIPVVGGFVAGMFLDSRKALIATAALWITISGLLLRLAIVESDLSVGTWVVIAIGLIGFPLSRIGARIRRNP